MSVTIFELPPKTSLDAASDVLAAYLAPDREVGFEINAAQVDSIDGAAVMTLANIAKTAAAAGAPVSVRNPTSAFVDAFTDLGLFEDLMRMEFQK